MKWIVSRIVFEHVDKSIATDLISDIFYQLGVTGVVVDDPDLEPEEGWGDDTRFRPEQHAVSAYIADNDQKEERLRKLDAALNNLPSVLPGIRTKMENSRIDEADWAESWKAFFWPEKVGDQIVIKPTWREYEPEAGEIVVEIDPGMAFGTGTHPTTSLCIQLLEKHIFPGCRFLDIGTGSGVLLVTAAKLGASRLCGVDKDEVAVDIARSNLSLNRVNVIESRLVVGNLLDSVSGRFDVVAANILSEVILELLEDLPIFAGQNSVFIASGIISRNSAVVVRKMEECGFCILEQADRDGWLAIAGRFAGK